MSIICLGVILFIIDYLILNISYLKNRDIFIEVYDIHGNENGYVPQGITYSKKYNVILQTSYNKNDISMLYVIDYETGNLIKELKIKDSNGNDSYEHVGGITTNDDKVWISNDYLISEFNITDIMNAKGDSVKSIGDIKTYNRGDFCYYDNNILWIGDFYLKNVYDVDNDNPLLIGYEVNNEINLTKPVYAISIPKMFQGMSIVDGKFVFTSSYSNLFKSNLYVYKNVLEEKETKYYYIAGVKVPYHELSKEKLIKNVKLSPMAEGIFYNEGYLYIEFGMTKMSDVFIYII